MFGVCIAGLKMFVEGLGKDFGLGVLRVWGGLRINFGRRLQGLWKEFERILILA